MKNNKKNWSIDWDRQDWRKVRDSNPRLSSQVIDR